VKGLAVALYLLGLSYGAVSLLLEALGLFMSKTLVYYTVQEAARKVPGLRRDRVMEGVRVPALGSDVTSVKVKGKWKSYGLWRKRTAMGR
jgi:transposase-like protein